MQVTRTIGVREVIPVRAIPFIAGMPPIQVASVLAHDDFVFRTIKGKPIPLAAYRSDNDKGVYPPIFPKEWDDVVAEMSALSGNLEAGAWNRAATIARPMQNTDGALIPDGILDWLSISPEEIEMLQNSIVLDPNENIRHEARRLTRPEWLRESLKILPARCFVWRDEFEEAFHRAYSNTLIVEERQGDRELNYDPLLPDGFGGVVLEGFTGQATISVNEYRWERLLGQFERWLRQSEGNRRKTDMHGADVLASVALLLKQAIGTNQQAPSEQAIRFRDELKARADERRQNQGQQNEADVLDFVYRKFVDGVMEALPAGDAAATILELEASEQEPQTGIEQIDAAAKAGLYKKTSEVKRVNEIRAFLMDLLNQGIASKIEVIWLHMKNNAGKENFLFKSAGNSTATTTGGKTVKKENMARTLRELLKTRKTD